MNYSKKVLDYFMNPRNVGEIKNADGVGVYTSPVCGDVLWLYLKIEEKNGKEIIKDAKFKTFGCAASIASGSILTEIVKGKTLKEAKSIDNKLIVEKLEGLPKQKLHCSVLAEQTLQYAIADYESRRKK